MTPKTRRWIISDTHLGHTAIQKHTRRPADVDEIITRNCKRLIGKDDLVIHVGDVSFNFFDIKSWLRDQNGKWILVRGNHDSRSVGWYMDNGFWFACDALELGGRTSHIDHQNFCRAGVNGTSMGTCTTEFPRIIGCSPIAGCSH